MRHASILSTIARTLDHRTAARTSRALAATVGTVALGTLAACGGDAAEAEAAASAAAAVPATLTVGAENVALVARDTIESGPAVSGTLAPEEQATLRAEVGGTVLNTYAEQGQRVARGAVLARIEDVAIRDVVLSARSGVTSAQLAFDLAQRNAARSAQLLAAGAIAEREAEQSRATATAARAQLSDARARLASAQQQLSNATVRAPFSGIVSERAVSAGDVVAPGGAMYTVVNPSSMRLEASVPAEQLADVRVGSAVSFSVSGYAGRSFTGKVTRVNPVADPATRQVRIIVSVPNAGSTLVGGLFAEGRVASESRAALVVPATAIDQRGLGPVAMRLRGGKVERVPVEIGLRDAAAERVEVRSGLAVGDTVLLGAAQGISAGTPVTVGGVTDARVAAPAPPATPRAP
jgi:RND family efflux transporter MFP subunit